MTSLAPGCVSYKSVNVMSEMREHAEIFKSAFLLAIGLDGAAVRR